MPEIDWEALMEGGEPPPSPSSPRIATPLSGLRTLDSDLTSTATSPRPRLPSSEESDSESRSFLNVQSVNDLLANSELLLDSPTSPRDSPVRVRSAVSLKSNVTFDESEPEVFNLVDEFNLLSVGELSAPEEEMTSSRGGDDVITNYSGDSFIAEEEEEEVISEEIKSRSDGWQTVKDRVLRKGKSIPVFMVGPKRKKLTRDISFNRSLDQSEMSQLLSRKSSIVESVETTSRKSSVTASSKKSSVSSRKGSSSRVRSSVDYSSDEITTSVSTTTTTTTTRTALSKAQFKEPYCQCRCKEQRVPLNFTPTPLLGGVTLDKETLRELAALTPDRVALLNIMKSQFALTKGLLEITNGVLHGEIEGTVPEKKYTTLKGTKKFIEENQPYGRRAERGREKKERRKNRHESSAKRKSTKDGCHASEGIKGTQ